MVAAGAAFRGAHPTAPAAPALETGDDPVSLPTSTVPERRAHRAALPVRVEIPAIGVRARLVRLGLDAAGALEVPADFRTRRLVVGRRRGPASPDRR